MKSQTNNVHREFGPISCLKLGRVYSVSFWHNNDPFTIKEVGWFQIIKFGINTNLFTSNHCTV